MASIIEEENLKGTIAIVANYPGFAGIIPIFLAFPGFPFFFSLSRFFLAFPESPVCNQEWLKSSQGG